MAYIRLNYDNLDLAFAVAGNEVIAGDTMLQAKNCLKRFRRMLHFFGQSQGFLGCPALITLHFYHKAVVVGPVNLSLGRGPCF